MKKLVLMFLLGLPIASAAMAAVPNQMNVQGRLLNAGSPMTGSHPADFKIYDAASAGNLLWTESSSLIVQGGIFTATLGSITPIPTIVFDSSPRWLEVTMDGTTLNPRLPLTTSAYAFRSQRSDTATVALNGVMTGSDSLWKSDGANVWRSSGNVGIGLANPQTSLDMVGGLKIRLQPTGNNSGMSFNTAAESPSIGFYASDNSPRFTLATQFSANNLDDVLRFNGNPASDLFVLRGNGNVGLGTSSPVEQLHLERTSGTAAVLLRSNVPGTGTFGAIQFQNTLATGAGIAAQITAIRPVATWGQESDMIFSTNPGGQFPSIAERIRITKDGSVGIGTASPVDKLEVAGNMTIGAYDGTSKDVVLRASGGTPNAGGNSQAGSNLVLRSGIATGSAGSGDIVFQVSDNVNYGNQQPHGLIEAMRIHTTTADVSIAGSLAVTHDKCRAVEGTKYGTLYFNSVESGEAIFTTSGRAQLENGKCHVELNPKWLAGVTIDGTHRLDVSTITFYGPHGDWYVVPGITGFDVVDPSGSASPFFWTVQARQKGYEDRYLNRPEATAAK